MRIPLDMLLTPTQSAKIFSMLYLGLVNRPTAKALVGRTMDDNIKRIRDYPA